MKRRGQDFLGYLSERMGGLDQLIPRDKKSLISAAFRALKNESARYFEHRGTAMAAEMAGLSQAEQIKILKEAQMWRALAGVLNATNVELPPEAQQEEEAPKVRKRRMWTEEDEE